MSQYDITKPRFSVKRPFDIDAENIYRDSFETLSRREADFWRYIGYHVTESRWNGKIFVDVK